MIGPVSLDVPRRLLLAGSLIAVTLTGCQTQTPPAAAGLTGDSAGTATVTALARLEPGQGVIELTGPVGERITHVLVKPGESVKAGQQLAEVFGEAVLRAQVSVAKHRLQQAQQMLDAEKAFSAARMAETELALQKAQELPPIQIETQQAEINVIQVQLQQAERDLERMQRLTSEAERDRQQQLIDRLREQLRALRAKLRLLEKEQQIKLNEAQRGLDSAKAGLKKAELAIDVEAARQAVALAEAELERVTLLAPVDAVVLEVDAQAGQTIGQRPILTLGETASMFAVAEIYQSDVQRVALGQKAVIRTPAIPGELTGVVESVGSVVQRNQVFGLDPTARTDARVVEARIRLDQPDKAARFIGLQVDVTIDIPPASAP